MVRAQAAVIIRRGEARTIFIRGWGAFTPTIRTPPPKIKRGVVTEPLPRRQEGPGGTPTYVSRNDSHEALISLTCVSWVGGFQKVVARAALRFAPKPLIIPKQAGVLACLRSRETLVEEGIGGRGDSWGLEANYPPPPPLTVEGRQLASQDPENRPPPLRGVHARAACGHCTRAAGHWTNTGAHWSPLRGPPTPNAGPWG